jgi:hypothetical protein
MPELVENSTSTKYNTTSEEYLKKSAALVL